MGDVSILSLACELFVPIIWALGWAFQVANKNLDLCGFCDLHPSSSTSHRARNLNLVAQAVLRDAEVFMDSYGQCRSLAITRFEGFASMVICFESPCRVPCAGFRNFQLQRSFPSLGPRPPVARSKTLPLDTL